jgi:hypothetical protein
MNGPWSRWRVTPGRRLMLSGLTAAVVVFAIAVALAATTRGSDESQAAETNTSSDTKATSDMPTPSTPPTTSAPTQDDSRPTPTEAEPTPTSLRVEGAGVLGRQDTAPPGVADQFEYYEMGDPPCSAYGGQKDPTIAFEFEPAIILEWFYVCIAGFDVTSPIEVTVVASDGSTVSPPPHDPTDPVVPYEGVVAVSFIPDLMAPTGHWTATAVQGDLTAGADFTIIQPPIGSVRVIPDSGTRGTDFQLELAGFAPGQPATIDVYRSGDGVMRYVTSVVSSPTDELGRAEHTLVTSPTDPAGTYCFVGRGAGHDNGCPVQSWLVLD